MSAHRFGGLVGLPEPEGFSPGPASRYGPVGAKAGGASAVVGAVGPVGAVLMLGTRMFAMALLRVDAGWSRGLLLPVGHGRPAGLLVARHKTSAPVDTVSGAAGPGVVAGGTPQLAEYSFVVDGIRLGMLGSVHELGRCLLDAALIGLSAARARRCGPAARCDCPQEHIAGERFFGGSGRGHRVGHRLSKLVDAGFICDRDIEDPEKGQPVRKFSRGDVASAAESWAKRRVPPSR